MSATIKDLAEEVGVSEGTISRALNGYDDVSPQTREEIFAAAERLNYRPNAIARGLARNKTETIGLFVLGEGDERHPFAMEIISGVMHISRMNNYDILLFSESEVTTASYIERCQERSVDGAIIMGIEDNDPYLEEIKESQIPIVLIDIPISGQKTTYVSSHNVEGAFKAVKYLLEAGHKKIAFMNGHQHAPVSKKRLEGYKSAYKDFNLEYDENLVLNGQFEREVAYEKMKEFLRQGQEFTAVFAASDLMALGIIDALKEAEIRIPEDVAVIGFDDIELCTHIKPALSTVRQKRFAMGEQAVKQLISLIDGESEPEPVLLDNELIIRESVN